MHTSHITHPAAAKASMQLFLKSADATPRERDLIKSVTDNELIQSMIGSVKVRFTTWSRLVCVPFFALTVYLCAAPATIAGLGAGASVADPQVSAPGVQNLKTKVKKKPAPAADLELAD